MNNEKITKERVQLLVDLESQMGDAMMNVLVSHDLNVTERISVIASAVIDILDLLADKINGDRKYTRDIFIEAFRAEEPVARISGKDIIKLTNKRK